jgi:hypothetical protein
MRSVRIIDRSEPSKAFKRGMDAHNNPQFYRQLGRDPELLLRTALELLQRVPDSHLPACFGGSKKNSEENSENSEK